MTDLDPKSFLAAMDATLVAVDRLGQVVFVHDPIGKGPLALSCQDHGKNILGCALPEQLRISLASAIEQCLAGEPIVEEQCESCGCAVAYRCVPITGQGDLIEGVSCMLKDISRQAYGEKIEREHTERFRAIFDGVGVLSVQGYDEERRVIFWNQASEILYRIPRDQAMGQRLEDLIIPQPMRQAVIDSVRRWLEEDEPIPHGVLTLQRGDASPVTVYSMHALIYNASQKRREMYCIDLDLSERIAMEQQLRRALQLAESGSLVKSRFLDTINHETRTPLNGVLGFSSVLRDTPLSEEQLSYVDHIITSGNNLLQVLSDILDLSTMESGSMEIFPQRHGLHSLVNKWARGHQACALAKGLTIEPEISEDVPCIIFCDAVRVGQIVSNLLDNAVKFTQRGTVRLHVSFGKSVPRGPGKDSSGMLAITVSDTGIGMEDWQVQDIFSAFSQLDSSTSRAYGGIGLGLTICKNLTDLLGGTIACESALGVGSTFTVRMPVQ